MSKAIQLVSVMMVATSEGYYKNRIIRVDEEFLYQGGLNRMGGLPIWADPLDKDWKAKLDKKPVAPVLPVAPEAPLLPPAPVVKPLTKAELVAKLQEPSGKSAAELNKLKLPELQALDSQNA